MALSSGAANQNYYTNDLLNDFAQAMSETADDISTATTSDIIPFLDASDSYILKYGDSANVFELLGITASAANLNLLAGVTAGTVTASKALAVDANKMLSSAASITTGVMQIQMTSDGTTAARAFKSRAYGPAGAATHGDLIGLYGLAETQGGGSTSAANTTIAGFMSWTYVDASDNLGTGNVVTAFRAILEVGQDVTTAGGRAAIIYGELWGTAGATIDYGLGLQNNLAGNKITSMIWMRSAGDDVTNAIELSNAPYFDSLFEFNAANTDKCIEANTNSMGATATAYHLRITVGGTPYYIPAWDNKTWS